jgi:hypothetical protein
MSNVIEPLTNTIWDTITLLCKSALDVFNIKHIDFTDFFNNINMKNVSGDIPKLRNKWEDENYKIYEFIIPTGMTIDDFNNNKNKFCHLLNKEKEDVSFKKNGYYIQLRIKKEEIVCADFDLEKHKAKGYKIPIGINLEDCSIRYIDFSEPSNAHMYLAGATRCGKSNCLRVIISQLVMKRKCDVVLDLINEKRVDLFEFRNCKNVIHYTENRDEAEDILFDAIQDIDKRYELFTYRNCTDIWQYRKFKKMPIRFIVIEELSSYMKNKDFHNMLALIASRGAGAGVFLILTTQLPSKDILPNITKQNINIVIGGKCKDEIRSNMIINYGYLHLLRGAGNMRVFDYEEYGTEIQTFYIDRETVLKICEKYGKKKEEVK